MNHLPSSSTQSELISKLQGADCCCQQAHVDLSEVEVGVDVIDPLWLPLYGEKHGKEVYDLGEIRVAVWFSRSGAMDNDNTGQCHL